MSITQSDHRPVYLHATVRLRLPYINVQLPSQREGAACCAIHPTSVTVQLQDYGQMLRDMNRDIEGLSDVVVSQEEKELKKKKKGKNVLKKVKGPGDWSRRAGVV